MFEKDIKFSRKKIRSDPTDMMSMTDLVAIDVVTPRVDSGCSLEKNFTRLIYRNP